MPVRSEKIDDRQTVTLPRGYLRGIGSPPVHQKRRTKGNIIEGSEQRDGIPKTALQTSGQIQVEVLKNSITPE